MKKNLTSIGLTTYAIMILIIVAMSITSCSSGHHVPCYAYQNIELEQK